MKISIRVDHYYHGDERNDKLERILEQLLLKFQKLNQIMANEIDDLTTEVEETKGIMASAKTLIEGFAEALRKAGQDPAKLKALRESLDAGSADLAAGIAANPLPGEVVVPPVEPPVEPIP